MTKYVTHWTTADNRHYILEDMDTEHLLNVYKHTLNNAGHYIQGVVDKTGDLQAAMADLNRTRFEVKSELLSRGIDEKYIESWHEGDKLKPSLKETLGEQINNFERITINPEILAEAIMGTDIIANIQKRTLQQSIDNKLSFDECTKRNIEYFKQWLQQTTI